MRPRDEVVWPSLIFQTAKTLWLAGATGQAIADYLGGGLTRQAVIAKMTREGIEPPKRPTFEAILAATGLPARWR